jgi:hypothetical protein
MSIIFRLVDGISIRGHFSERIKNIVSGGVLSAIKYNTLFLLRWLDNPSLIDVSWIGYSWISRHMFITLCRWDFPWMICPFEDGSLTDVPKPCALLTKLQVLNIYPHPARRKKRSRDLWLGSGHNGQRRITHHPRVVSTRVRRRKLQEETNRHTSHRGGLSWQWHRVVNSQGRRQDRLQELRYISAAGTGIRVHQLPHLFKLREKCPLLFFAV